MVALAITLARVVESRDPHPRRLDWIGFLTFSLGLAGLASGLIRSHADGWGATNVAASLIAPAVLLAAFVVADGAGVGAVHRDEWHLDHPPGGSR